MSNIAIHPLNIDDQKWVSQFITEHWGADFVVSRGVIYHPRDLPGFVAVHRNALELSRRLKPGIPLIGDDGIPLRDEIELELTLDDTA